MVRPPRTSKPCCCAWAWSGQRRHRRPRRSQLLAATRNPSEDHAVMPRRCRAFDTRRGVVEALTWTRSIRRSRRRSERWAWSPRRRRRTITSTRFTTPSRDADGRRSSASKRSRKSGMRMRTVCPLPPAPVCSMASFPFHAHPYAASAPSTSVHQWPPPPLGLRRAVPHSPLRLRLGLPSAPLRPRASAPLGPRYLGYRGGGRSLGRLNPSCCCAPRAVRRETRRRCLHGTALVGSENKEPGRRSTNCSCLVRYIPFPIFPGQARRRARRAPRPPRPPAPALTRLGCRARARRGWGGARSTAPHAATGHGLSRQTYGTFHTFSLSQ